MRTNRIENCPVGYNAVKKEARGTFDYQSDQQDGIIVCSWNDNNVVTLASNTNTVFPLSKAVRWSAKEKKE